MSEVTHKEPIKRREISTRYITLGKPEVNWIPFNVRGIDAEEHAVLHFIRMKDRRHKRLKVARRQKDFLALKRIKPDYGLSRTMQEVLTVIKSLRQDKINPSLCEIPFLTEYIAIILKISKKKKLMKNGSTFTYWHKERVYQLAYFIKAIYMV